MRGWHGHDPFIGPSAGGLSAAAGDVVSKRNALSALPARRYAVQVRFFPVRLAS